MKRTINADRIVQTATMPRERARGFALLLQNLSKCIIELHVSRQKQIDHNPNFLFLRGGNYVADGFVEKHRARQLLFGRVVPRTC